MIALCLSGLYFFSDQILFLLKWIAYFFAAAICLFTLAFVIASNWIGLYWKTSLYFPEINFLLSFYFLRWKWKKEFSWTIPQKSLKGFGWPHDPGSSGLSLYDLTGTGSKESSALKPSINLPGQAGFMLSPGEWFGLFIKGLKNISRRFILRFLKALIRFTLDSRVWKIGFRYTQKVSVDFLRLGKPKISIDKLLIGHTHKKLMARFNAVIYSAIAFLPFTSAPILVYHRKAFSVKATCSGRLKLFALLVIFFKAMIKFPFFSLAGYFGIHFWNPKLNIWQQKLWDLSGIEKRLNLSYRKKEFNEFTEE